MAVKKTSRNGRERQRGMLRRRAWAGLLLGVVGLVAAGIAVHAWHGYTRFKSEALVGERELVLVLKPGTGFAGLLGELENLGLPRAPYWQWRLLERELGVAKNLKAGEYQLSPQMSAPQILQLLASGKVVQHRFTILEGTRFADLRLALAANGVLQQTIGGLSDAEILARIGAVESHAEGLFLPETYHFPRGFSDLELLGQAYWAMQRELQSAWDEREAGLPIDDVYSALILASVVEKESGAIEEQPMVAGVFVNRLRIGMRLQSDPTVIYGLGDSFDGNLRRVHLRTDNPYNSYTRSGLPPTPIAMPGPAAIRAVLHPARTEALYFVARGDGRHQFSRTLQEHNRAVRRYQLGGG